VRRYDDEIGRLEWAAPQDHKCRPGVLSALQPRPGRPLRQGRAPHRSGSADLTLGACKHNYEQMATLWGNWAKLFFNNKGVAAHGTDVCAGYPPNDPSVWNW
jgi:hypothetical protein